MDNLLQLQQASKAFGSKELFKEASFAINKGEHIGVIGPNGAGKSTLFKILVGEEQLDSGKLVTAKNLRLGYLTQHDQWDIERTVEDWLSTESTLPLWEVKPLGVGLGLTEKIYAARIAELSGGYRMRVKLLHLLAQEPHLMLLDEPTNYLDLETLLVLEKFLQDYRGAFLLISHDREFLRRTTDHTLEVEQCEITKFNGNIDDYFEQKELLREQLESRAFTLEAKRQQILTFVARFGAKATKAGQAQSKLKTLAKMEQIELKPLPVSTRIRIPSPSHVGRLTLSIENGKFGYGRTPILDKVWLQLASRDHVAVVGFNGAGKSTLLKTIAGRLAPLSGELSWGYGVTTAFFAQHVAEELDLDATVLESLQKKAHPNVLPQEILDLAGALLFSGQEVQKTIRVLSGGERSRVALGQVLLQKASCLILDEPTNHLDFQTVEALTQALQNYEGCILFVSHDRSFVKRLGTRILEIYQGQVNLYPGTYDDYVWSLEKGAYATIHESKVMPKEPARKPAASSIDQPAESHRPNYKDQKKDLDRRLRQVNGQMEKLDQKISQHQRQISALNQSLVQSMDPAQAEEMGRLQLEVNQLEEQWFGFAEERERIIRDLEDLVSK